MKKIGIIIILAILGLLMAPPLRAQTTETYTFSTNRLVPDGNASGLADVRTLNSDIGTITSVTVQLSVTGQFNGDLYAYLRHSSGFTVLLNRPGKTASNLAGDADSGLNVTFQNGAINGDIHDYQNVTTPLPGSPLTGIWAPDGRNVDPTNATDTSPRTTSLTNFNGLSAAGQWTLYLADMQSGASNELTQWSLSIVGASYPALTWPEPANIVYGTALGEGQLNASATFDATNVPGTFVYTPPLATVLQAGSNQTLSVTFTPSNTTSFLPITTNVTINVSPAPLTITAVNTNKVYGSALPAFTASYSGFVNGDSAGSLTTPVTLATTATASNPVGAYNITPSGAVDANYTITEVVGTLNITPAPLTITANNTNKVYGAALPAFTASYSGFVNGDTAASLTTPVTLATTATAASPVGAYSITAGSALDANYSISYAPGTLTITQAGTSGLIVSSANPSLPGTNVTFTVTITPVAPGAGTPSGTVNFRIDGNILGSRTLSGGVAVFATNNLPHGSNTVVVEYAGDANFFGVTNSLAQAQIIDTPPVAGNLTIERFPAMSVKVSLATLLTNASDADGDALTITVNSTSSSNMPVTITNGWVFYTPTSGFTNADSFTYTVTDGFGESATGTVFVVIEVDNSPGDNLSMTNLGNGMYLIVGSGIAGRTYRLESATSLSPANWQLIPGGSVTAGSTGSFQYTNTPSGGTNFYRTIFP